MKHNFKIGDKVTISDGGWWDGKGIIRKILKSGIRLEGSTNTIPFNEVRLGHSKTWEQVQSKFGSVWYK